MMNITMQNIFNDINGRVICQPHDALLEYAKNGKLIIEKLRR